LRALADYTHGRGLMFGLWCEIEALGAQAKLAEQHPELVATRDGTPLGYVCLGCPDAREWAFRTLERLVHEYDCDWIKLDFNLDPGAGCDRTDHGHGAGDGLYAHYRGYYAVLDRVREQYPRVVLENCSSGGLRVDPEIVRHTHLSFLSDPDWPEHNLQVFWGATTILAPEVCLHWSWSQTLPTQGRAGFDPRDPALTSEHLDYVIRTALLGAAGFSLRLPDVPPWVRERIRDHVRCYDRDMSRFILEAELHRLTDQPDRESAGDRWCAFQYSLPAEHMLVVFRLPGAEPRPPLHMRGLNPEERYRLTSVPNGESEERRGRDLMEEGLALDLPERGSTVILIQQENMPA
jgi:alpha-galactosidase